MSQWLTTAYEDELYTDGADDTDQKDQVDRSVFIRVIRVRFSQ